MKYKFFTVSSEAWDAMLTAINFAQKSIYWECYILLDDTPTHNFFSVLKEKAKIGVRVKLIADALGSFWLESGAIKELQEAGVEVLFFNHLLPWWSAGGRMRRFRHWWLSRNHKKILIIDEQIGFIGGVNVGKQYANWIDLHVRLQGVIVRALIKSFSKSYKLCGGKDVLLAEPLFKSQKIRLLDHFPSLKMKTLKKFYLNHLNKAEKNIIIATPYFIPHYWLIKALKRASKRGVVIEIIIPQNTDYKFINWANHTFALLLSEYGVDFYFTNEMIHAKSLLVDEKEGVIGSNNIDATSFDYNSESSLIFNRKDMIQDLKNILESWKKSAEKFDRLKIKKTFGEKIWEKIFQLLQPIL